jgi:hypothetical protein
LGRFVLEKMRINHMGDIRPNGEMSPNLVTLNVCLIFGMLLRCKARRNTCFRTSNKKHVASCYSSHVTMCDALRGVCDVVAVMLGPSFPWLSVSNLSKLAFLCSQGLKHCSAVHCKLIRIVSIFELNILFRKLQ